MRDALSMLVYACESFYQFVENGLDGHYEAIPNYDGGVGDFLRCVDAAKAALSDPPRNCDKYRTHEEAEAAWNRLTMKERLKYRFYIDKWLYDEAKG